MKNQIDFRKIGGGLYGAINFNNMIPVPQKALIRMNIEEVKDLKYRNLLRKQYRAIVRDIEGIEKTAYQLREMLLKDECDLKDFEKEIKKRSCNLKLLEQVYMGYEG
jgi:protein AbiQ